MNDQVNYAKIQRIQDDLEALTIGTFGTGFCTDAMLYESGIKATVASHTSQLADMAYQVNSYGVPHDGITDASPSLQSLIDTVPDGSTLKFNGIYLLNTNISFGTKLLNMITSPRTEFIGTGVMPGLQNPGHYKQGTVFESKPSNGRLYKGDSALSAQINPQSAYQGNAVGLFSSAMAGTTAGEIWGANIMVNVEEGYTRNAWGLEIDVNTHASTQTGSYETRGLDITGEGQYNPDKGLVINRAPDRPVYTPWKLGMLIKDCVNAAQIQGFSGKGLQILGDKNSLVLQRTASSVNSDIAFYLVASDNSTLITTLSNDGQFTSPVIRATSTLRGTYVLADTEIRYPKKTGATYTTANKGGLYNEQDVVISSLVANGSMTTDITVTGVATGEFVSTTLLTTTIPTGLIAQSQVVSSNTIRVTFANISATPISNLTVKVATMTQKFGNY